ncbi:MAG: EAL domain-containing protein [Leptospiraceae bacterium]
MVWFIKAILLLLPLLILNCQKQESAFAAPGIIDLRNTSDSQVVTIHGPVRFYPNQLLSETEFQGNASSLVQIPGSWNLYPTEEGPFGNSGYGTFEFTVLLSQKSRLGIKMSDIGTAYRLYVDRELLGHRGKVGRTANQHEPDVGEELFQFKPRSNTVMVHVEVSNFSYRKGGVWNPITIGDSYAVGRMNWRDSSVQTLMVGILLIMGLYHCGFFLIRKQETALFFFGLSCFLVALRELTLGPRLLPLLLPEVSWVGYLRMEYFCFFLALPVFAYYGKALFPRYFYNPVSLLYLAISVFACGLTLFTEPLFFSHIIPYFQYVMLTFIIYGLVGLIRAATRTESGARTLLVSSIIMAATVVHDTLLVRHYYDGPRIVALGQIQFVVAQAFMLALRFSRSMRRVETYNQTMQQRNDNLLQLKSSLELRSLYDDLTGVGNRSLLMDTIEKLIRENPDEQFSLMLLDIDDFRKVNDSAGHIVGDTMLIEIARRLKYKMPARDQLFRLEGDEFAVIHYHSGSSEETRRFGSRLRDIFSQPVEIGESSFQTTVSVGIAHFPEHGQTPLMLFRSADSAVIHAKREGKDREEEFDSESDMEHRIRLDLSERLEQAIRNQELSVYFQPIVDLKTSSIIGGEALLRWQEPELGFVAPDVFIPIAEETGQIRQLGGLVLEESMAALARWNNIRNDFSINVNISPGQLNRGDLRSRLRSLIEEHSVNPANIKLEITENLLLQDKNIDLLQNVRELGIRLVMDDFGTGYSSFAYLQKNLFEVLKIDKSFMLRLLDDEKAAPLVRAMVQMAHSLGLEVVAEGIETQEIADYMAELNCEMGQGYLYSKAIPIPDFEKLYIDPARPSLSSANS